MGCLRLTYSTELSLVRGCGGKLPREEKVYSVVQKSGAEACLYYYGARYYDPSISLWLSVDPLAEYFPHVSPYAYTFQNPVMYIDPTGMVAEPPIGLEQADGTAHTDSDGSWKYNKSTNIWVGQNGSADIENAIQLGGVNLGSLKKAVGTALDVGDNLGMGASSILKARSSYGSGYANKPITIQTKIGVNINTSASSVGKLAKAGRVAGKIGKGLVFADIVGDGRIRASHVLTTSMIFVNAIPIVGNAISGVYFAADLVTMGVSYGITGEATGIGGYLDKALDGGVIVTARDVGLDYDGVY